MKIKNINYFERLLMAARNDILNSNLEEAKKKLKRANLININSHKVYNLLGVIEEYQNDIILAQKYYQIALVFDGSYKSAINNLERTTEYSYSRAKINLDEQ